MQLNNAVMLVTGGCSGLGAAAALSAWEAGAQVVIADVQPPPPPPPPHHQLLTNMRAYEILGSDWSSDVCSSDLTRPSPSTPSR